MILTPGSEQHQSGNNDSIPFVLYWPDFVQLHSYGNPVRSWSTNKRTR